MAALNGSSIMIFNSLGEALACQRGVTIAHSTNLPDATCKQDQGWKHVMPGLRQFTINCEALTDYTTGSEIGINELYEAVENRTSLLLVAANPAFSVQYYEFTVFVESIELGAIMEDVQTYNVVFSGTGDFSNNLLLNPSFELGSGDVFTNWTKLVNPNSDIIQTANGGLGGTRAVAFEMVDADCSLFQTVTAFADGENYKISLWAKKNAPTGGTITINDASGNPYGTMPLLTDEEWHQYTFGFTWEDTYETVLNIECLTADFDSGDELIIDNIELTLIL